MILPFIKNSLPKNRSFSWLADSFIQINPTNPTAPTLLFSAIKRKIPTLRYWSWGNWIVVVNSCTPSSPIWLLSALWLAYIVRVLLGSETIGSRDFWYLMRWLSCCLWLDEIYPGLAFGDWATSKYLSIWLQNHQFYTALTHTHTFYLASGSSAQSTPWSLAHSSKHPHSSLPYLWQCT